MHVTWWMPSSCMVGAPVRGVGPNLSGWCHHYHLPGMICLVAKPITAAMRTSTNHQLSDLELAAWRGFLRVHSALVRELDRELESQHGLPLTQFEVLVHLNNAPDHRLRMSELASTVLLSQSGVTRLVDRLERDGLVVREPCPNDRRGLRGSITDGGMLRLAATR